MALPPVGWMTGVFGDDFAFNCTALEDHRLMPEWGGQFAVPEDKLLNGGWVYRDGEVRAVTRCIKRTQRDSVSLFPTHIEMEMTDSKRNSKTILKTEKLQYNAPLKEDHFTLEALRRGE